MSYDDDDDEPAEALVRAAERWKNVVSVISPHVYPRCPDEGRCWHRCESHCWRILNAGPLSAEEWPGELVRQAQQAVRDDQRLLANTKLCLECEHEKNRHGDEGCLVWVPVDADEQTICSCIQRYA